jgi:hypothetical protein
MTNVDLNAQRTRIKAALLADPVASNRTIAKQIDCHHVTVGAVRRLLEAAGEISAEGKTLGADGKSYTRKARTGGRGPRPPSRDPRPAGAVEPVVVCACMQGSREAQVAAVQRLLTKLKRGGPSAPDLSSSTSADTSEPAVAENGLPPVADVEPVPPDDTNGQLSVVDNDARAGSENRNGERNPPDHSGAVVGPVADEPVAEAQRRPAKKPWTPPRSPRRNVTRDITPDDYNNLPLEAANGRTEDLAEEVEGQLAEVEEAEESPVAEQQSPTRPARNGDWTRGTVDYINLFTQCGRVYVPEFGDDLQFSDKTPREAGLVLRRGLEVDCRFVERHGHPWIVELARPAA